VGTLRDLREVLGGLRRRGRNLRLCPVCGSPKIRLSSRFDVWLTPEQYVCEDCGYRGPIVMEVEGQGLPGEPGGPEPETGPDGAAED